MVRMEEIESSKMKTTKVAKEKIIHEQNAKVEQMIVIEVKMVENVVKTKDDIKGEKAVSFC
jgi:hypothetical protein